MRKTIALVLVFSIITASFAQVNFGESAYAGDAQASKNPAASENSLSSVPYTYVDGEQIDESALESENFSPNKPIKNTTEPEILLPNDSKEEVLSTANNSPSPIQITDAIIPLAAVAGIVTQATLTDSSGNPLQTVDQYTNIRLNVNFSLPDNQVHAGDTSTIALPSEMRFSGDMDFEIRDGGGNLIANAHVDAASKKMVLTYTNYPETHSGVTGSFFTTILVDANTAGGSKTIPVNLDVEGTVVPAGDLEYRQTGDDPNEKFWKYGWFNGSTGQEREYSLRINGSGQNYQNAVVSDRLQSDGAYYDKSSFVIAKGQWVIGSTGSFELSGSTEVTSQFPIQFDADDKGFSVNFGDINGEGYIVRYLTKNDYTAADGEAFKNNGKMTAGQTMVGERSNEMIYQSGGGAGEGYTYSIRIKKINAQSEALPGAEFEVVRDATGASVGSITTGSNGEGSIGGLLKDNYSLKETKAPVGYQLSGTEIKITPADFGTNKEAYREITNQAVPAPTVSIKGDKQWVDNNNALGTRPSAITVTLLADGAFTTFSKQVSSADGWQFTFDNLPKFRSDGQEIVYTLSETSVAGYTSGTSGTAETGFTIVNTIDGRVSVPVTKVWEGLVGKSITIHLLADGQEIDTHVLDETNEWQYIFLNLAEYDTQGRKITYSIREDVVEGYSTRLTGSAEEGFVVTNTQNPQPPEPFGPPPSPPNTPPTPPATPPKPSPSIAKTGDPLSLLFSCGAVSAAGVGLIFLVVCRKLKKLPQIPGANP